ncbi:MAG TPA: hypothetical protein VKK61_12035, partial [Tepidisphaeraceae bacterium]|nr:hypothetical protein [Tepidisphaeraceae bacterium]
MFHALHWLIVALYIAAPLAAILIAFARTRADDLRPMGRLFFTIFVGTLLGTTGAVVYALSLGARAGIGQIFLTIYFATAVLLSLRGFDFLIRRTLRPIFLSNHNETSQHHFGFILLNLVRLIL